MNNHITAALLGLIAAVAGSVMAYWHCTTRGSWKDWPAGRSLMGLLAIIALGFGYGMLNRFLGEWPGRPVFTIVLYALFVLAIGWIGITIRTEMRSGKQRLNDQFPIQTGPVTVVVATKNEEIPNEHRTS